MFIDFENLTEVQKGALLGLLDVAFEVEKTAVLFQFPDPEIKRFANRLTHAVKDAVWTGAVVR